MTEQRTLEFEIPGTPQGKGRPCWKRLRSGKIITYTPKATVQAERIVRGAFFDAAGDSWTPWAGPVTMNVRAYFTPPKNWPEWRRALLLYECIPYGHTPDSDNIWKLIGDAGNGIIWKDDRQVDGGCWRYYALRARTEVNITFFAPPPTTKAELEAENG